MTRTPHVLVGQALQIVFLCPISVDDSWKSKMDNPIWGHLSDKLILDFSPWKTKAFDKQFDKLLKGMKINHEVRK